MQSKCELDDGQGLLRMHFEKYETMLDKKITANMVVV